jgi:2-octaprenyl-6-methoxyphenol hydroxylase
MKVCIFGSGLISLTLAKCLVNMGIYVDIFSNQKINKINKSRTLGISKTNIEFFNKDILNIEKLLWPINKIEIYSKNLKNEKVLNFENNNYQLFSIVKNYELYKYLIKDLNKSKFFQSKKIFDKKKLFNKGYKLIINCEPDNFITKKFFYKKINKKYNSYAHTTIINHKKILNNNVATQIFTEKGPIAFLPMSKFETSVVYSVKGSKNIDLENLIRKYNTKYSITKIYETFNFELKSSILRSYHYKNILAFGDLLHKLHPLAGQGFNMSLRDIKELLDLIRFKMDHGLELDESICKDFEKKSRHKNYLFSNGIDFVYEFFNLDSKMNNPFLSKSVQLLGKNRYINKFFTKFADNGIII